MLICNNCGAELEDDAKFCVECGTPVLQVKKCVQCGKDLPLRAKFCSACGISQEVASIHTVQSRAKVIVDCNGQGDALNVSEALRYVDDGAAIVVQSGIYKDSFVIDKEVTICGEDTGKGLPVIWNDTDEKHFIMQVNANAKISDLILQGAKVPFTADFEYPKRPEDKTPWEWWPRVVEINSSCALKNINVCNSAGHGFAIAGEGVEPQINGCKSFDNRRMGFLVIDKATPSIANCKCYSNLIHGFSIGQGASPKIETSKAYKNRFSGLLIFGQGHICIDKCDVFENGESGVCITERGMGSINGCNIYENDQSVDISQYYYDRWEISICDEKSLAIINNCKIGNCPENGTEGGAGCRVKDGAKCVIEKTKIIANHSNAAVSCFAAFFEIKDSHLDGVGDENYGQFQNSSGLQIEGGSEGEIDDTFLTGMDGGLCVSNSRIKVTKGTITSHRKSSDSVQILAYNSETAGTEVKCNAHFIGTTINNGFYVFGDGAGEGEFENIEDIRLENCCLINTRISNQEKLAGKLSLINTSFENE